MTAEDTTTLTSARLDLWLWSVRIFKTRSLAADECKGGHVRVNDAPAKPSQKLKKGDVVRVRYPGWERRLQSRKTPRQTRRRTHRRHLLRRPLGPAPRLSFHASGR